MNFFFLNDIQAWIHFEIKLNKKIYILLPRPLNHLVNLSFDQGFVDENFTENSTSIPLPDSLQEKSNWTVSTTSIPNTTTSSKAVQTKNPNYSRRPEIGK